MKIAKRRILITYDADQMDTFERLKKLVEDEKINAKGVEYLWDPRTAQPNNRIIRRFP